MFTLTIETGNWAFTDDGDIAPTALYEVARILREVADRVEGGDSEGAARDVNGNTVGAWRMDG